MKSIKFFKSKSNKLKLFIAIFFTVLMLASILGVLATNNNSSSNLNHISADSTNVPTGCSSSVSVGTSYYTNNAVANSGTSTVYLPVAQNSSQASSDFSYGMSTSGSTTSTDYSASSSGNLITSYYYDGSTIDPTFSIPAIYTLTNVNDETTCGLSVGTVTVTITAPNGDSSSWSHTFNNNTVGSNSASGWVIVTPSISFSSSMSGTFSVSITETNDGNGYHVGTNSYSLNSGNFITDGSANGNSIVTSQPSQSSTGTMYGWHYGSVTTTATIPQYESSYDISWSSNAQTNPVYNSDSQSASSGTFTGSLTDNSITINPVGDPNLISGTSSTYSFSYYLSNQYQVSSASTTQSTSASYSYSQVTTNEMNSSFSFSIGTPSGATFVPYESSTNSLTTSTPTVTFSPQETVSNPYYSYAQNQLNISISNAATYSSSTSNSASPTFDLPSSTYSSSTSPTWDVNLFLYGNRHPVYVNSAISQKTVNPLTPVTLYANYSEAFSGETQYLYSTWNGHSQVSSASTTSQLMQEHAFSNTGTKSISFYAGNSPDPATNSLSDLYSSTSTATVDIVPFVLDPSPTDYSSVGTSVNLTLSYNTQTSAKITSIQVTVNGALGDRFSVDSSSGKVTYDFTQPSPAPILVVWKATDQYGYSQSITFQYGSSLNPALYSNKVTVLQSDNSTDAYPINLNDVPTGNGTYQQLITISNPSDYNINSKGSNIQFTSTNGTLLYAWIQNINSTEMQVWVKNYNSSSVIIMQVFPSFENLFSANGYLGEAPDLSSVYGQYFNAPLVFGNKTSPNAWDFANSSFLNYFTVLLGGTGSYTYGIDLSLGGLGDVDEE